MPGPATILKEIHRLRRHAHDLRSEIKRVPLLIQGQRARLTRQEEEVRAGHDKLKQLKVGNRDKEVQLKQTQELMIKHQDQMNSASSKKEYDAFKIEIAHDRQRCQQLEDEILATMLEIDERTAQLPELDKTLERAKQEFAAQEKELLGRQEQLQVLLRDAEAQLKEVETSLTGDVRTQYDRLVGFRGEDAMSAVQGRTCVACYTEITAQNYNDLVQGQFLVCKSCGRMLYLAE
jgi:predicted  nucleic acid-binding Zn-ribbon protein